MEQTVRFCTAEGGARIAYAMVGSGLPIIFPPPWVSHLELEWEEPAFRAFAEALARQHTVVRYDRLGCGLSDRRRPDLSLETDVRALEAVISATRASRVALFGASMAGPVILAYAARHPRRVSHLFLYGTWGVPISTRLPEALAGLIRVHWGIGSKVIADLFLPGVEGPAVAWYARFQRESATADMAADLLLHGLRFDASPFAPRVRTPATVLHRKGDKMTPFESGRTLAAMLPAGQFIPLEGDIHRFYFDNPNAVLAPIGCALGDPGGSILVSGARSPVVDGVLDCLTRRELDVLRLIGAGLSNKEIAHTLGLQVPTVERHAVNLYQKLGARSRADAVRAAVRHGLDL